MYKIQKILNKVKLQNLEKELSDFANFLGNKSLGSEIYLSVNMLHQAQLYYQNTISYQNELELIKAQISPTMENVSLEKTTQDSENQILMEQVNVLIINLKQTRVLESLLQGVDDQRGSKFPLIDSNTLKHLIMKGLNEHIKKSMPSFNLSVVSDKLINLLKFSPEEQNQIYINQQAINQTKFQTCRNYLDVQAPTEKNHSQINHF